MQIYDFFGINSKKVMTFWEWIPKKSYFLMLNYIQDNALIALVCSLKVLQIVTLSCFLFFKQQYCMLRCHIQIIAFQITNFTFGLRSYCCMNIAMYRGKYVVLSECSMLHGPKTMLLPILFPKDSLLQIYMRKITTFCMFK